MKLYAVSNSVQRKLWQHVKIDYSVVKISKLLTYMLIREAPHDEGTIIDEQIKQLVCLSILSDIKPHFGCAFFLSKVLNLWQAAYHDISVFEPIRELALHQQEIISIGKQSFEIWNNCLKDNNLIDETDYIIKCIKKINSLREDEIPAYIHDIENIKFHSSIEEEFPDFCKKLTSYFLKRCTT